MNKTINIHKFKETFNEAYEFLYDNDSEPDVDEAESAFAEEFDEFIKSEPNKQFVCAFNDFRQDFISSDREAAAFMLALHSM